MINKKGLIGLLVVVFLVLIAGFYIFYSLTISNSPIFSDKFCELDSECVKVQTTCCPCSMGGEEDCVSYEKAKEIEKELEGCDDTFCIALYNCQDFRCGCEEGLCVKK